MAEDYMKLKVTELRALLKERGIPATGLTRKQQIVEKLEQADKEGGKAEEHGAPEQEAPPVPAQDNKDAITLAPEPATTVTPAAEHDRAPMQPKEPTPTVEYSDVPPQEPEATSTGPVSGSSLPVPADSGRPQPSPRASPSPSPSRVQSPRPSSRGASPRPSPTSRPSSRNTSPQPPSRVDSPSAPTQPIPEEPATPVENKMADPAIQESALAAPETTLPVTDAPEEALKRKRRSATPPPRESDVSKKLKLAEEDPVHFEQEDEAADPKTNGKEAGQEDVEQTSGSAQPASLPAPQQHRNALYKPLVAPAGGAQTSAAQQLELVDRVVTPAKHPATAAVYARNFQRPLREAELSKHLTNLAEAPTGGQPNPTLAAIEFLYLDPMKTHCFAIFSTVDAAARVRSGLHEAVWPADQGSRNALFADFVPPDDVKEWVAKEKEVLGETGKAAMRFEVDYQDHPEGVIAVHRESGVGGGPGLPPSVPARTSNSSSIPGLLVNDMEATIPGSNIHPSRAGLISAERRRSAATGSPVLAKTEAKAPPAADDSELAKNFHKLDDLFRSTETKPKLYFKPVSEELANKRLDEMDKATRPNSRGGRADYQELHRYTFDDGDRLLDGGYHKNPSGGRGGYRGGRNSYRP